MTHPPSRHLRRVAAATTAFAVGGGLALGGAVLPAAAAAPEPDLHYSMDDVAGAVVPDSSRNGWDGTLSGEASTVDGPDGAALDLGGGSIRIPREPIAGATDLSVTTRVRWDGGANWQWLFGLGTDNQKYLFFTPSSGDGNLRTAITRASGGGAEKQIVGSNPLRAGEWVDLAFTLDTDADQLTAYVNGTALSTTTTDITPGELVTATSEFGGTIGSSFYPDPAFDGAVDDFRIYRSALTAAEVAEISLAAQPALQSLTQQAFTAATRIGEAPVLAPAVRGQFSDGYARDVAIAWEDVPAERYAVAGTFTVQGTAAGQSVRTDVTVARGQLTVDLSKPTGEFQGGASGLLYGLYGDGMPTDNLIEGMNVRSVATKAQDGGQHPGSDALEILPNLARAGGDVYLRITDYYRGFPYQVPGSTPAERRADYADRLADQLAMIEQFASVDDTQRGYVADHLVIEPFNEPEGNMFSNRGVPWSLSGNVSWLDDPTVYYAMWDDTYRTIRAWSERTGIPLRVAGPGTEHLFEQVNGFLRHTVQANTVPDIVTWHELSHPQAIRESVARYRGWESAAFAGTAWEGKPRPININEYAFNYHTSVPGQMVQWISAIEDTKVEAMIAFWNINGNLSDSAVQQNRGNGQWWLYNAYAQMSGQSATVTPPSPGVNYTLQGVASVDADKRVARALVGGANGSAPVDVTGISSETFGGSVRVQVREIGWTGQIGDSSAPRLLSDRVVAVENGTVTVPFGRDGLPAMTDSDAYEIIVTPGENAEPTEVDSTWRGSYEAEDAAATGDVTRNGPEGSPNAVGNYYTSGGFDIGGFRTGADSRAVFTVDVPEAGSYDLSVFSSSLNTDAEIAENGPTNVFVTVDGGSEQEVHLPLSYKWVVWDHADTRVELTAGRHEIALSTSSLDGSRTTRGDAILDRITLERTVSAPSTVYEAEHADHNGEVSAQDPGSVALDADESATFWVYGETDGEARLEVDGTGGGTVSLNGEDVLDLSRGGAADVQLQGGVNKIVVHGAATVDKITVSGSRGEIEHRTYQAEEASLAGTAAVVDADLADGGKAVDGIGGDPGNGNTLTFDVDAAEAGPHAVVVRFSNPEQVPATHYNPNPMARHADISVNDGDAQRVLFVPTFHRNNFWERTLVLDLKQGRNEIRFASSEQPNFDGETFAEDNFPGIPLRAELSPIIDRIVVSALAAPVSPEPEPEPNPNPNPGPSTPPTTGPTTQPAPAGAPSSADLSAATQGAVSGPATIVRGETVKITVGTAAAGRNVSGWLLSTPTALGSGTVATDGTVTLRVPTSAPLGGHRLAITAADGGVIGWYRVTVVEAGSLAATGGAFALGAWVIGGAALAGAGAALARAHRRRGDNGEGATR
ncbi:LamG-like jellyroll fold domain-containing protein [Microbacterium radiodurans]|uniref:Cellulosome enzyme n=1 Tax=Microbacterium radiodurans TaxID=661398 RepID=A0A5J5IPT1_9MICO|nr:LamG-like jellyroll fold domain-containing protein [Microbacterium radiodurans]KAA9084122.1 cellulosome enzyme [Microbacterium radiodurans]